MYASMTDVASHWIVGGGNGDGCAGCVGQALEDLRLELLHLGGCACVVNNRSSLVPLEGCCTYSTMTANIVSRMIATYLRR
jgi:hypothetical protein